MVDLTVSLCDFMFHINLVKHTVKNWSYFTSVTLNLTFIWDLVLDIVVTYLHAKNEVNRSNGSKVIIQTDCIHRQTDASKTITFPLLKSAKITAVGTTKMKIVIKIFIIIMKITVMMMISINISKGQEIWKKPI